MKMLMHTKKMMCRNLQRNLPKQPFQIVTTVHKDVTERLAQVNPSLAAETRKVLDVNKSERHIRGGLATKEKYLHQH